MRKEAAAALDEGRTATLTVAMRGAGNSGLTRLEHLEKFASLCDLMTFQCNRDHAAAAMERLLLSTIISSPTRGLMGMHGGLGSSCDRPANESALRAVSPRERVSSLLLCGVCGPRAAAGGGARAPGRAHAPCSGLARSRSTTQH